MCLCASFLVCWVYGVGVKPLNEEPKSLEQPEELEFHARGYARIKVGEIPVELKIDIKAYDEARQRLHDLTEKLVASGANASEAAKQFGHVALAFGTLPLVARMRASHRAAAETQQDQMAAILRLGIEPDQPMYQLDHDDMAYLYGHIVAPSPDYSVYEQYRNTHAHLWGDWGHVDPHTLNPDQRWEYQKWVWGAPRRWVQYLIDVAAEYLEEFQLWIEQKLP
jgi:hypothetical protein